jgi:hypothetical protein
MVCKEFPANFLKNLAKKTVWAEMGFGDFYNELAVNTENNMIDFEDKNLQNLYF